MSYSDEKSFCFFLNKVYFRRHKLNKGVGFLSYQFLSDFLIEIADWIPIGLWCFINLNEYTLGAITTTIY